MYLPILLSIIVDSLDCDLFLLIFCVVAGSVTKKHFWLIRLLTCLTEE